MSNEVDIWRYTWGIVLVPLTWLWHRVNSIQAKTDDTRIILAERHYTKLEVHAIVDSSTKPIHDKLDTMQKDISYLVREKRK